MLEMKGVGRIKFTRANLKRSSASRPSASKSSGRRTLGRYSTNSFFNEDETECLIFERYRDCEAGLVHSKNVAEVSKELAEVCDISGEVFGDASAALRKMLEAANVKLYTPFNAA